MLCSGTQLAMGTQLGTLCYTRFWNMCMHRDITQRHSLLAAASIATCAVTILCSLQIKHFFLLLVYTQSLLPRQVIFCIAQHTSCLSMWHPQ